MFREQNIISRKKKRAFSLVELTVVLVIIACILATLIVSFVELTDKNSRKSAYSVMEVSYNFLHTLDISDDGILNTYLNGCIVYKDTNDIFFYVCTIKDGVLDKNVERLQEVGQKSTVEAYNNQSHIADSFVLPSPYKYEVVKPCDLTTGEEEYSLSESVAFYLPH